MATKLLTKQRLWDFVIGATVLGTGGGGILPSESYFDLLVDSVYSKGLTPRLIDASDVHDDQIVFMRTGASGGVCREVKERYMAYPDYETYWHHGFDSTEWVHSQLKRMERLYPLPHWAERPTQEWAEAAEKRLVQLVGQLPLAYVPFEIGAHDLHLICSTTLKGKPVVDADVAGHRATPEFSLAVLNIVEAPIGPVVLTTVWGDIVVYERLLSWQRLEDLNRHIAISCGGAVMGMMAVSGMHIKQGTVAGSISKAMRIGRAIRVALEEQKDPVRAAVQASEGYLLFLGLISGFSFEEKGGFVWGETRVDGTEKFRNHTFDVWYKNENLVAWLDGVPYVTAPDLICILDRHTGQGLSNFWRKEFYWGREVAVIGIPCAEVWRTARGRRIFNPWRFGHYIDYVAIEERFR